MLLFPLFHRFCKNSAHFPTYPAAFPFGSSLIISRTSFSSILLNSSFTSSIFGKVSLSSLYDSLPMYSSHLLLIHSHSHY